MKISIITPTIRPEGLKIVKECLRKQTLKDFEWLTEVGLGVRHDLNEAYNKMIRRAKGELLVFYQDYIEIPEDGLERFWDAYEQNTNYLFTAPVGKTRDWKNVKWDWRNETEECTWQQWEIDWGACSASVAHEIGGFDEELDGHWSFDNVNFGFRAHLEDYKFKNVIDNKAVAWDHDNFMDHPFRDKYNPVIHNKRLDSFKKGLRVNFL